MHLEFCRELRNRDPRMFANLSGLAGTSEPPGNRRMMQCLSHNAHSKSSNLAKVQRGRRLFIQLERKWT